MIHGIPYIAIVQGYALILRRLYGSAIAGWRLGVVMLFAMAGMAVGGWLGGAIFDVTLSYRAGVPGGARLQPPEPDAARPALSRPAAADIVAHLVVGSSHGARP